MFTGLVQHMGAVVGCEPTATGRRLRGDAGSGDHTPALGDSIAVDGCCLTVTSSAPLAFDVVKQTLGVTTLGGLAVGDQVNLEHAATPTTLLGGHVVQGHIDGCGTVVGVTDNGQERRLRVTVSESLFTGIVLRGSVALAGVSMTVAQIGNDWFEVALIPTTIQHTNLGILKAGASVNVETDYLVKAVGRWLEHHGPPDSFTQQPSAP